MGNVWAVKLGAHLWLKCMIPVVTQAVHNTHTAFSESTSQQLLACNTPVIYTKYAPTSDFNVSLERQKNRHQL